MQLLRCLKVSHDARCCFRCPKGNVHFSLPFPSRQYHNENKKARLSQQPGFPWRANKCKTTCMHALLFATRRPLVPGWAP